MEEPKRRPSMMSKYVDSQVKIAFKNKYPISIICEFEKLDKEMCDRLYWKNQLISQEKEKGGALANAGLKEKKIFSYESPGGLPDIGDARTLGWIYPYGLAGGLFLKQWKMGLKNRPKLGGKKYYLDLRRYRGGTLASAGSL